MKQFCLMSDSCCDLDAALAREMDLTVLPLSLHLEGKVYRNLLDGGEIGFADFYARLRGGAMATTSAVSVGDYEAAMEEILRAGQDILCLCFSSALSGTYQSACIAAEHLKERFPDRTVRVVDTLCASGGQGLLAFLCARERDAGRSLEEVRAFAEREKGRVCHWFTVNDLNHLKRGGRINAAAAFFGSMLSIKPVLHVDGEGRLIPVSKARGRKASLLALVDRMAKSAENPENQTVFITHGDCPADAEFVAGEVRRRFGTKDIRVSYVGPVIGNHSGPGTLALFFLGRER